LPVTALKILQLLLIA
jgi:hypothetical protein